MNIYKLTKNIILWNPLIFNNNIKLFNVYFLSQKVSAAHLSLLFKLPSL